MKVSEPRPAQAVLGPAPKAAFPTCKQKRAAQSKGGVVGPPRLPVSGEA